MIQTTAFFFVQTTAFILLLFAVQHQIRAADDYYDDDHRGNQTDQAALLAIKTQLIDNNGVLSSWNHSLPHCLWEGVTCGHKHNRVTELELYSRNLGGTISPFIGNLSFLRYIWLANNTLSGHIPPEIGRLNKLRGLYLHNNSLSGEIPGNISGCINLLNLSVAVNNLHGELPMGLGALSNLKNLWVYSNKLSGPIFKVIANLASLEDIEGYDNAFMGTISPFVGNLSFLRQIELSNNCLSGQIPPEIGRLNKLQGLDLYNNSLNGEIPANISGCINLLYLSLAFNNLHGELPMGLGALSNLKNLWVYKNQLSGPIFKVIANLTSLEDIEGNDNAFTGTIPDSISRMRNLTRINLDSNKLMGKIPPSLFNISSLQILDLYSNQLQGNIPHDIGYILPQLQWLSLFDNYLSGPLPTSIQNLTSLQAIQLDDNNFTGNVSLHFGHLHRLQWLQLSNNNLEGDINFIIRTLLNCSSLTHLDLSKNKFTGVLPKFVANLSINLVDLHIWGNPLNGGHIPMGISNLINLECLVLSESKLTGPIPQELGKLQRLESLYLYSNHLTGDIPTSFINMSRLSTLWLGNNYLEGRIPPTLGSCQNLIYLYLSNNNFKGPLPGELFGGSAKFIQLYLSQNQLEGFLPEEVSKQINLVEFSVSQNKLSGEIPPGIGNLFDLKVLYMDSNFFYGSIPSTFSSLKSLVSLGLSKNNISGPIPEYFSTCPLIYLNLSYNNFEGKVPTKGVYANATAIFLDGNSRLCGGIPELHLPICVQKERKRRSMSHALKLTLLISCAFVGVLAMMSFIWLYMLRQKRQKKKVSSQKFVNEPFLKVSYDMLLKATNGFAGGSLLGSGTFGSVYKGNLDGRTIAVKVLNLQQWGGSKSFMTECQILRNIRHRNLLGIITACSSIDFQRNDFKALVYEFMSNGNLDRWLHEEGNLSLLQRMDIAIDVAHALHYLYHECEKPIVHCDLKPNNILLDSDLVARVADFGLAKFIGKPLQPNQSSSIGVRGTIGYAAPEYGLGAEATVEADIYSFGILLLELMTRKRPTDKVFQEDFNLHMYAKTALPDKVLQIVDSKLTEDDHEDEEADNTGLRTPERLEQREKCIKIVVEIGVACSDQLPHNRMKISEALSLLQRARNIILNSRNRRHLPIRGV